MWNYCNFEGVQNAGKRELAGGLRVSELSDDERVEIADRLLRDLWCAANGQPFPKMDRTAVSLVRR